MGFGGQCNASNTLLQDKLVPLVQKARWASRAILEGAENLAHHESSNPVPSSP